MAYKIKINSELDGWDLVNTDSNQSHDNDSAGELIATFYDKSYASLICCQLNMLIAELTNQEGE